jgi:hypothetical protein
MIVMVGVLPRDRRCVAKRNQIGGSAKMSELYDADHIRTSQGPSFESIQMNSTSAILISTRSSMRRLPKSVINTPNG